jgi:hypothetical protein
MVAWIVAGYALVFLLIIAVASGVAMFGTEGRRGEMAYRVLKLLLGAATGAVAVVLAVLRLYAAGLLG